MDTNPKNVRLFRCVVKDCQKQRPKDATCLIPSDREKARKWEDAAGLANLGKNARFCKDHFAEKDFYVGPNDFKRLKPDAEPSIFVSNRVMIEMTNATEMTDMTEVLT